MLFFHLAAVIACLPAVSAQWTWTIVKDDNPNNEEVEAYELIEKAVKAATARYSRFTNASKALTLSYYPNTPTADGNYNGEIPSSFVHYRVPPQNAFLLSNRGLKVRPSRANLTGDSLSTEAELTGQNGLSLVGRRQSHTLFNFSIGIDFWPRLIGQESGLTVFRTQLEHIDLSLVRVPTTRTINSFSNVVFRLSGVSPSRNITTHLTPVPKGWEKTTIRLEVSSPDDSKYVFTARSMAALGPRVVIGTVTTSAVSGRGGSGFFVGSILGAFSSCNGAGFGKECPQGGDLLIKTWVYTGVGQKISSVEIIPMSGPTSY
ncbi:hypothetical protein AU210_012174 [Fusarium oxysporum f. sp. radicis-cucumerinum]|uniref:Beta-xylosidase C-terminal Concanavalin A-like domain-containing protein n=1 Tax=Fusarium oxysporum f. sp. radicis-cucumerinum TaxID=327505 RepID=A0A2H3GZK1_FUSOX|nr:hypothetical protein AU210_012174 [Fusarium oxysporum f. sp. radicis-cucumerinum]